MNAEPITHIVDDDEAIRDSLRLLLKASGLLVETHDSAHSLLDNVDLSLPGCLVVDVRMPNMSGLELQQHLNEQQHDIPLIIITGHGDISMAVQAMKAGACDFFEKPVDNDRLINRINECLDVDAKLHKEEESQNRANELLARLSKREKEIMDLLVKGKLNKVIAAELDISTRTVEAHRANIMEKLETHSLSDIVRVSLLSS